MGGTIKGHQRTESAWLILSEFLGKAKSKPRSLSPGLRSKQAQKILQIKLTLLKIQWVYVKELNQNISFFLFTFQVKMKVSEGFLQDVHLPKIYQ